MPKRKSKRTALWIVMTPSELEAAHAAARAEGFTTTTQWVRIVLRRVVAASQRRMAKAEKIGCEPQNQPTT